jgi:hypothetical protein
VEGGEVPQVRVRRVAPEGEGATRMKVPAKAVVLIVVVAVVVTATVVYLLTKGGGEAAKETYQLITKDPTLMVLTLSDVPSGYSTHITDNRFVGAQEIVKFYQPLPGFPLTEESNPSFWENFGFEVGYIRLFTRGDNSITSTAFRFSSVEGAEAFYHRDRKSVV